MSERDLAVEIDTRICEEKLELHRAGHSLKESSELAEENVLQQLQDELSDAYEADGPQMECLVRVVAAAARLAFFTSVYK